jgi:hypothetical protein
MKSYNIKQDMPSVLLARDRLINIIRYEKDRIIKVIHGYGSTGRGGEIKTMVHQLLSDYVLRKSIRAYIPGEAFGHLLGYDEHIKTYMSLLKQDPDRMMANEGATYIILY